MDIVKLLEGVQQVDSSPQVKLAEKTHKSNKNSQNNYK